MILRSMVFLGNLPLEPLLLLLRLRPFLASGQRICPFRSANA